MLHALATPWLATALVVFRPLAAPQTAAIVPAPAVQSQSACDDGTNGGTLVQRGDTWYGNRLALACASARLTAVEFTYFGAGFAGPYAYRLHFLDAECRTLATTPVWSVPSASEAPATVIVDLSAIEVCVGAAFIVALEPLSCADGATAQDCMPALVVDGSSDAQESAHCGVANTATSDGRSCLAPRSADGRFFDFRLRVQADCTAPENSTWPCRAKLGTPWMPALRAMRSAAATSLRPASLARNDTSSSPTIRKPSTTP